MALRKLNSFDQLGKYPTKRASPEIDLKLIADSIRLSDERRGRGNW